MERLGGRGGQREDHKEGSIDWPVAMGKEGAPSCIYILFEAVRPKTTIQTPTASRTLSSALLVSLFSHDKPLHRAPYRDKSPLSFFVACWLVADQVRRSSRQSRGYRGRCRRH